MRRGKPGISKATAYLTRVCTVEYDGKGMIDAYGIEFMHWLFDEIHAGRIDARQCVDRWSADKALYGLDGFSRVSADYEGDEDDYITDDLDAA